MGPTAFWVSFHTCLPQPSKQEREWVLINGFGVPESIQPSKWQLPKIFWIMLNWKILFLSFPTIFFCFQIFQSPFLVWGNIFQTQKAFQASNKISFGKCQSRIFQHALPSTTPRVSQTGESLNRRTWQTSCQFLKKECFVRKLFGSPWKWLCKVQDSRGSCSQLFVACKVSDNLNLQGMHARSQLENDYTEEICGVTTDILW